MENREYHTLREVEDTHWWFVSLNEHAVRSVREALPPGELSLLDAGCGTGGLATMLEDLGQVDGFDASPVAVALCRARGLTRVRRDDLNTLESPGGKYDGITCVDVLYHRGIRDEARALSTLSSGLRPGGVLYLHLPAYEWLRSHHDRRVHTRRRYRLRQVAELVRESGLRVECASYRVSFVFPLVVLLRAARAVLPGRRKETSPSDVGRLPAPLNRLLLGIGRLENRCLRRVRMPFGVSIFVVARKPRSR